MRPTFFSDRTGCLEAQTVDMKRVDGSTMRENMTAVGGIAADDYVDYDGWNVYYCSGVPLQPEELKTAEAAR